MSELTNSQQYMVSLRTIIRREIDDKPVMIGVIREQIKEMDLSELFSQADVGDGFDQRIDELADRLDNMPDVDDMKSDLDELEYKFDDKIPELEDAVERLRLEAHEYKEDWKAMLKGPTDVSPEVDAALRKHHQRIDVLETARGLQEDILNRQHKRIEELEHAMLCVFEYLFDDGQRVLARGNERFNDSLKGGE